MNSEENESSFQFSNPSTKEAVFIINPNYVGKLSEVRTQKFSIKTRVEKGKYLDESEEKVRGSEVFVTVTNNESTTLSEDTPFLLRVTMGANFKWKEEDISKKQEELFLNVNGASLLMSYIRPLATLLTEQAEIQPQYIPFVNFTNKKS